MFLRQKGKACIFLFLFILFCAMMVYNFTLHVAADSALWPLLVCGNTVHQLRFKITIWNMNLQAESQRWSVRLFKFT